MILHKLLMKIESESSTLSLLKPIALLHRGIDEEASHNNEPLGGSYITTIDDGIDDGIEASTSFHYNRAVQYFFNTGIYKHAMEKKNKNKSNSEIREALCLTESTAGLIML